MLRVRIEKFLNGVSLEGITSLTTDKIDELENLVSESNSAHNRKEAIQSELADVIYDRLVEILKEVRPESRVLSEIWEESDEDIKEFTYYLEKEPMLSIQTIKSYDSQGFADFLRVLDENNVEELFSSFKLNGHGVRVVYQNGILVSATSRARASKGNDLTRQLKVILGEFNPSLAEYPLVELRGEVVLPFENLEKARVFNPEVKSAFSGVSSMIRASASEEEISLLDFVAYRFLSNEVGFVTKEGEYLFLEECGYLIPEYGTLPLPESGDWFSLIKQVQEIAEKSYDDYGYFCDGIVWQINDYKTFNDLGNDGRENHGNVALKVGAFGQDVYDGVVQRIEWTKGKSKLSPVAIVGETPEEAGVLTIQGNRVSRVPLYEPANIILLKAYPGEPLKFKYGGEAGVVPLTQTGRLLTDAAVDNLLGEC